MQHGEFCSFYTSLMRSTCMQPTYLSRGDDVLIFGVLIDSEAEDVVCVLKVKALRACGRTGINTTAMNNSIMWVNVVGVFPQA